MNILNAAVAAGRSFALSAAALDTRNIYQLTKKHPKNPESYYGFIKLKTEEFLQWYDRLKGSS